MIPVSLRPCPRVRGEVAGAPSRVPLAEDSAARLVMPAAMAPGSKEGNIATSSRSYLPFWRFRALAKDRFKT